MRYTILLMLLILYGCAETEECVDSEELIWHLDDAMDNGIYIGCREGCENTYKTLYPYLNGTIYKKKFIDCDEICRR